MDTITTIKRIILMPFIAFLFVTVSGCSGLKKLGLIPSELEMALGLKDALSQGLFKSFDAFADPNGNPLVRFAFPGEASKIEKTLRDIGLDKMIDQVTGKFTKAMSTAVTVSKPIIIGTDKIKILNDVGTFVIIFLFIIP